MTHKSPKASSPKSADASNSPESNDPSQSPPTFDNSTEDLPDSVFNGIPTRDLYQAMGQFLEDTKDHYAQLPDTYGEYPTTHELETEQREDDLEEKLARRETAELNKENGGDNRGQADDEPE